MGTVDSVSPAPKSPPRQKSGGTDVCDDSNWVVYTPESPARHPVRLVSHMMADVIAGRELAWRLFVRNIKAQYRQSVLGYAWAFLPPLVTTAVFVFLKAQQVLNIDTPGMNYTLYLLTGIILWQTFMESLNAPLRLVGGARGMLAKVNFPREALLMTAFGEVVFNLAIRIILLVLAFIWFRPDLSLTLCFVPFGILALIALGMSMGLLLVPLGLLYQDVGRAVGLVSLFWMFVTPVLYLPPVTWPGVLVLWLNPVSPVLTTCRDWMLLGSAPALAGFLGVSAVSILIVLPLGLVMYRLAMPILIERM